MRWNDVQETAADWLSAGVAVLDQSPQYTNHKALEKRNGNYRMSNLGQQAPIGESNNLRKRAKRLLKEVVEQPAATPLIQVTYTDFGRRELQEFTCLSDCKLSAVKSNSEPGMLANQEQIMWEELQAESLDLINQGFHELKLVRPREWVARQCQASAGVYLVFKNSELIYLNQSQNVLRSLNLHSNATTESTLRQAIATYELGLALKMASEIGHPNQESGQAYDRHHLTQAENFEINHYLQECLVVSLPVSIGRLELTEALTRYYSPKLVIKQRMIT